MTRTHPFTTTKTTVDSYLTTDDCNYLDPLQWKSNTQTTHVPFGRCSKPG